VFATSTYERARICTWWTESLEPVTGGLKLVPEGFGCCTLKVGIPAWRTEPSRKPDTSMGWNLYLEGWTLYLEGWNLYLEGWNLYLEGWTLYLEGWTLYLEGLNLYLNGWNLYLEGWALYLELIYVVIVQVEVVHHEAAVEHPGRQTRQEVLAQVQLVNPLVVAAI
jgi:hypothetical protein